MLLSKYFDPFLHRVVVQQLIFLLCLARDNFARQGKSPSKSSIIQGWQTISFTLSCIVLLCKNFIFLLCLAPVGFTRERVNLFTTDRDTLL